MASPQVVPYEQMAVELSMTRTPGVVLKEAEHAAGALMKLVNERQLFKKIGSKKHIYVEAWETVGHFYRCHARTVDTQPISIGNDHGFKACAELVHMDTGAVLGRAEAVCMTDEADWKERPKYEWPKSKDFPDGKKTQVGVEAVSHQARCSMAQTRARSKVFRSVFDFVAVLAGYDPTPAEEMESGGGAPSVRQPERKQATPSGNVISEAQRKRLYALSKKAGLDDAQVKAILATYGYESSTEIEKANYESICNRVEVRDVPESATQEGPGKTTHASFTEAEYVDVARFFKAKGCASIAEVDAALAKWDSKDAVLEEAARWSELQG